MSTRRWAQPPTAEHIVLIEGTLVVESPVSIGASGESEASDQPVIRRADGSLFFPGTSLAGVLRHRLLELAREDPLRTEVVLTLLGGDPGDDDGMPSSLIVDDLPALAASAELRDHVRLAAMKGTAEDSKKYDREAVAVGSTFALRLEWRPTRAERKRPELLEALHTLVALLATGIRLGGHTNRGFGGVRLAEERGAGLRVTETDLTQGASLASFLEDKVTARSFAANAFGEFLGKTRPWPFATSDCELKLHVAVEHSLLVRGPGRQDADASALTRPRVGAGGKLTDEFILPGSSLAGAMRQRAASIGCLLAGASPQFWQSLGNDRFTVDVPTARVVRLVEALFGTDGHRKALLSRDGEKKVELRAGSIEIEETVVKPAAALFHTRVAIDPWTGGALESFLFKEEALYGGRAEVVVRVRCRDKSLVNATRGLAMLVLRDLWIGDLPVGGESGIGRGRLRGTGGELAFPDSAAAGGVARCNLAFNPGGPQSAGLGAPVSEWVRAVVQYLKEGVPS